MFLANLGGLAVAYGIPVFVKMLSPDGKINSSEAGNAWFIMMTVYAVAGLLLLVFCYTQTRERVVMDDKETAEVKVSDLWTEFKHNRPLRILALFFVIAFAMMAVVGFDEKNTVTQSPLAEQGILWLVAVIPALLLVLAMFIISRYELTDEVIDRMNREIENKLKRVESE